MNSLKSRYKELRLREISIKKELRKTNRMPKLEVLHWLDAVDNVKKQVKRLENSRTYKLLSCFSIDRSGYSSLAKKLSKEVNLLWEKSQFPNGVYPQMRILVEQCPRISKLFGTIWENLMDPTVSIMGIYGGCVVRKTTAMMRVSNRLATSDMFDSIFWVTVSKLSSTQTQRVYQLQTDLAQQMKLELPESGRASLLLEGLNKCQRFLIIVAGLCEALPLTMVGIPVPNRENRCKIVLITQDYDICHMMKSNKIIKVDTFSTTGSWNSFVTQLVKLCAGRPLLINAISNAMRNEVSMQVWRNMLAQLVGFDMVFNLLKMHYEFLKDEMVQKCLLYCALFPYDYFFKPEELIKYWVDANFIHGDSDQAIKIDAGLNIIRNLLDAKMMEKSGNSEDDCLKMTDIWRKWATNAMKKEPDLYLDRLCDSRHIKMVSKEMEELPEINRERPLEIRIVAEDIFRYKTIQLAKDGDFTFKTVMQCPERPQLLDTIWENLMRPSVRVLSIYGSWGVGKTTAMAEISKRLAVRYDNFDSIIWVTFSKALGLYQLQNDIALQMNLDLPDDGRATKLRKGLEKMDKFLIIIDDVTELISLINVGIPVPSRDDRYKIVLISRDIQVCYLMKSDKIIRVDTFSLTEKWNLFVSKAGNMVLTPVIEILTRQLVELCPGRPLIINAICHAMRDEVSIQVWRDTVEHLMGFETKGLVFELLRICYECLKDEMVQKCFLYCALYPEEFHFNPEELVRYWVAESFIDEDADIITKREIGFKIMAKLLDANMLEMSAKREDDWLKMPHMWREFAIKTMKTGPGFHVCGGLGWEKMPYNSGMVVEGKVSFMRNQIEVLDILPISYSSVSTLLLRENPISKIHPSLFTAMNALLFLDLSYTWITELPSTVSQVAQLRVLFLHNCTRLQKVPSLRMLTKLQVLRLSGTSIAELPHGMERLVSLRSLDLSDTPKLGHIRAGMILELSHLEELRLQGSGLCMVDSPMVANYLMEMRCLKRLSILTISAVCYGDLLETIMCLQEHNLKIFSIKAYGTTEDCDEDV